MKLDETLHVALFSSVKKFAEKPAGSIRCNKPNRFYVFFSLS
ncbi:hypothetical protein RV18_GL000806 [Enterococcus termitis]|nr:hypothetical protein RV18_GL000806 [Enterococcus termitis]